MASFSLRYHEGTSLIQLMLSSLQQVSPLYFTALSAFHTVLTSNSLSTAFLVKSLQCCNSLFTDLFAFLLELMTMWLYKPRLCLFERQKSLLPGLIASPSSTNDRFSGIWLYSGQVKPRSWAVRTEGSRKAKLQQFCQR